jgi:hypothetical protein
MRTEGIKVNCKIFLPICSVLLSLMGIYAIFALLGYTLPSPWNTLVGILASAFGIFGITILILCKKDFVERDGQ